MLNVPETAAGGAVPREHDGCKHERIYEIGNEVRRMQPEKEPNDRTVGIAVPGNVQRGKFVDTNHQGNGPKHRHQGDAELDLAKVLACRPLGDQIIRYEAGQQYGRHPSPGAEIRERGP